MFSFVVLDQNKLVVVDYDDIIIYQRKKIVFMMKMSEKEIGDIWVNKMENDVRYLKGWNCIKYCDKEEYFPILKTNY